MTTPPSDNTTRLQAVSVMQGNAGLHRVLPPRGHLSVDLGCVVLLTCTTGAHHQGGQETRTGSATATGPAPWVWFLLSLLGFQTPSPSPR